MEPILLNIFREVFNDPDLEITEETTAADVAGWDSFNHLTLIMAIEEAYSISFTSQEIGRMARVGSIVELLQEKLS